MPNHDYIRENIRVNIRLYLRMAGVPKKYLSYATKPYDMEPKQYAGLMDAASAGKSFLLTGDCGTGKTALAVKMMSAWMEDNLELDGMGRPLRDESLPRFVNMGIFLLDLTDANYAHEAVRPIIERYASYKYLVLDEFPERLTDSAKMNVGLLMELRHTADLPTIITSNLSAKALTEFGMSRMISRFCSDGAIIELAGADHRKEGA